MKKILRVLAVILAVFTLSTGIALAAEQYDQVVEVEPGVVIVFPEEEPVVYEILSGRAKYLTKGSKKGALLLGGDVVLRATPTDPGCTPSLFLYRTIRDLTAKEERMLLETAESLLDRAFEAKERYDAESNEAVGEDYRRGFAEEVLQLVNVARAKAGVRPLQRLEDLTRAAAIRAEELTRRFSHTRPDGRDCFTAIKGRYRSAGENIAAGQRSPAEVMDSWMHSEGHRRNILNPAFKYFGLGFYAEPDSAMKFYWTQLFTG